MPVLSENLIERLDLWRKATDGIGRFSLKVDNTGNQWDGLFLPDDSIEISIAEILFMRGYFDKGHPISIDSKGIYQQTFKLTGRDYGQDLQNKLVDKTGDWMYEKQPADDIIDDMLSKVSSEITFTSPSTAPEIQYTDAGDEFLSEAFRKICEKINYDFYVDEDKALHLIAIDSAPDSGIILKCVAGAGGNNIIGPITKTEFDSYELRNYIIAKSGNIEDGWTDGNVENFTGETGNILTNEFTIVHKGTASIKCEDGTADYCEVRMTFPKHNYPYLPFDLFGKEDFPFWLYVSLADAYAWTAIWIELTDNQGLKIKYGLWKNNIVSRRNLWYQYVAPVGTECEIRDYEADIWPLHGWIYSADPGELTFNWKVTGFKLHVETITGEPIAYVCFDDMSLPFPMISYKQDATSQTNYKVRFWSIVANHVHTQLELDELAANELEKRKDPIEGLKITAIGTAGFSTAEGEWFTQELANFEHALYSGARTRAGQRHIFGDHKIDKVSFYLRKYGMPTGTAVARIRNVSGDTILATSDTLDVSTLTDTKTWKDFIFPFPVDVNGLDVRVAVEYSGGDGSNYIQISRVNTNPVGGKYTQYQGSWTETDNSDVAIKIYNAMEGNFWIPGYKLKVNSPGDGFDNAWYRIVEVHVVVVEEPPSHGHDFFAEVTLVPDLTPISGMRQSYSDTPEIALLRALNDKLRFLEMKEEAKRDWYPPLPAPLALDALADGIFSGEDGLAKFMAAFWTIASRDKFEEGFISVETQDTSVAAGHSTTTTIASAHSTVAVIQTAHSTTAVIASAHSTTTVIASAHSTTTSIQSTHSNVTVVASAHGTTTSIQSTHSNVTVIGTAHSTSTSIATTHGTITVIASAHGVAVVNQSGHTIVAAVAGGFMNSTRTISLGTGSGVTITDAGYTTIRSGTVSGHPTDAINLAVLTAHINRVADWARIKVRVYVGGVIYHEFFDYFTQHLLTSRHYLFIPTDIGNGVTVAIQGKADTGQSVEVSSNLALDQFRKHTHSFSAQPSGHPVTTQPANHSVGTQPSGHSVSVQPSGHPVNTQPSGHPVTTHPTGHTVTTQPSGHPVTTQPSGHTVSQQPSGHSVQTQPSGHIVTTQPSGHTVSTQPSGHDVTNPSHRHLP